MNELQIKYYQSLEDKRSNLAKEAETHRSNVAQESETHRHNVSSENISLNSLLEAQRHNKAVEAETNRHNVSQEQANLQSLREVQRHNVASEILGTLNQAEQTRHNVSVESETARANRAQEELKAQKQAADKQYQETTLWLQKARDDLNKISNLAERGFKRQQVTLEWAKLNNAKNQYDEAVRHNKSSEALKAFDTFTKIAQDVLSLFKKSR